MIRSLAKDHNKSLRARMYPVHSTPAVQSPCHGAHWSFKWVLISKPYGSFWRFFVAGPGEWKIWNMRLQHEVDRWPSSGSLFAPFGVNVCSTTWPLSFTPCSSPSSSPNHWLLPPLQILIHNWPFSEPIRISPESGLEVADQVKVEKTFFPWFVCFVEFFEDFQRNHDIMWLLVSSSEAGLPWTQELVVFVFLW